MKKSKLLIIVQHMPYPLDAGGKKAQFEFIEKSRFELDLSIVFILKPEERSHFEVLKSRWSNVTFYPFFLDQPGKESILSLPFKLREIFNQKVGGWYLAKKVQNETDRTIIRNTMIFRSKGFILPIRFISHVKQVFKKHSFDIVQIEFHQLIGLIRIIPQHTYTIFVHHELRFVREERELRLMSDAPRFLKKLVEANKIYEFEMLRKYDLVCTLSEIDKKLLQQDPLIKSVYASPIPIKLEAKEGGYEFKNKLVFVGGENHFPNKDGLEWFIDHCWNILKVQYPKLELDIVGKWSEATKQKYSQAYDGICFLGYVEDLDQALRNKIAIVPIRIGSGIRIKIIDSVNVGAPFVTTTVGVEGLNFHHEKDCMIGDTVTEFTDCISKVICHETLGITLANSAKCTLLHEYDYEQLINIRLQIYLSINHS